MALVTFSLGATLAVFVAGSASAAGSKGTTTKTTTTKTTTTTTETPTTLTTTPDSPAAHFFVINGTANAASDHQIVGSSAFPNYTTGAVDNYYSMAHSHVDNSPFAEGRASPADTGPIGQTAAAGNTQQPQYADARWPGDPPKATYGSQGGPYATAVADEYRATADASEASNGLSGPGPPNGAPTLAVPKGFNGRLQQALAGWKGKWQGRLAPNKQKKGTPTVTTPVATVPVPKVPVPKVPVPQAPAPKVATPSATVTTPVATVTTPNDSGGANPAPPVTVPSTSLPTVGAAGAPRSMASASTPADGESLLASSTLATLDPKTNTLVTSGESSLGRVSLGGGQIAIEGIHVTASIANDGTPSYKAAVSVASATIGGVPVTIDQDGVHVAGQGGALPYQQASDALNGALKQAGIQLFLVGPEVTKPCGQTGTGTGGGTTTSPTTTSTTTTTTTTTSTSSDQSGTTGSCDQTGSTSCDSSGGGGGTGPGLPSIGSSTTTTSSNNQTATTATPNSCDQTGSTSCDQTGTTTNGTTTTGGVPGISPSTSTTTTRTMTTTTTRTSTDQTNTTTTPSGCGQSGTLPATGSCGKPGTATGTTTTDQTDTTSAPPSPFDPLGGGANSASSGETVRATGVHLVFTQPVNQSGVPAQYVEHILGEVVVDSLAVPAGNPPNLDLSSSSASSSGFSGPSSCGGGHSSKTTAGGTSRAGGGAATAGGGSATAVGGSPAGGSTAPGSLSPSGSTLGSTSRPSSSSAGNSLPTAFASALRKPLWLLLAYVLWQALVIGTGASLWNWRRDEAS
jgi:hypothetical protein